MGQLTDGEIGSRYDDSQRYAQEYDEQGLPWIGGHRLFWTVTEYALKTGTRRQNILAKIKRGTLKAVKLGNQWLIPDSTI